MSQKMWKIAVNAPISEALTYSSDLPLVRGMKVKIPLGKRESTGVVIGEAEFQPLVELKSVIEIDSEHFPLPDFFIDWLEWIAKYYIYPIGQVTELAFPPLEYKEKQRKSQRAPVIPQLEQDEKPNLTIEQKTCIESIAKMKGFNTHLVFGVTGSGKTEVYLHLLEKILAEGKNGLVLVPEISLTPQLIQRFAKRFGNQIAAIHSQLTDREKTNQWWEIRSGHKKILIGARSALFCPIENLGIIIVDEEHEPSYKQDEKLKYHGRDSAVMLGRFANCPVVLGSATPSLESWKNAVDGKYKLHTLKNRVADRSMPLIEVVDIRQLKEKERNLSKFEHQSSSLPFWLSPQLFEKMSIVLERGEQVSLFLNRRGIAQMVVCQACGHTRQCPNCDINLTLHAGSHMVCHYCDYHETLKEKCSDCREGILEAIGLGTELIEQDLARLWPNKKIARADRDEIQNRLDLENLVEQMEKGEIDILIGTQMIAKGLDFPKLKLVGLVLADVGFNLPDFRASERSFQLITQMSGRSGRHVLAGESPGEVVIQTYNVEHDSIRFAINHDYVGFAEHELKMREELTYPPIGKMISIRLQGIHLRSVEQASQKLAQRCEVLISKNEKYQRIHVLGPVAAPIARLRGQFRFYLILKSHKSEPLTHFASQVTGDEKWLPPGVRLIIDVDPIHIM